MSHKSAQFYTIGSRFELFKLKKKNKKANTEKYTFSHRESSKVDNILSILHFSNDFKIIVLSICSQTVKIAKYELYSILQC